jgi:sugar phosphate isomerase/epimerase
MYSRRDLGRIALAAPFATVASASIVNGVRIGAQSYSFRELPDSSIDAVIDAYKRCALGYAELWQGHLEPKDRDRAAAWRKNPPFGEIKAVRARFDAAGVVLYAFYYSFREEFSDAEIENGFKIARALGVRRITTSANLSTVRRIDRFAQRYKTYAGMHNHSEIRDNEFARPEDFAQAMSGTSKYIAVNLDIGHFTAAGYDPVEYLRRYHQRILTLHIKDRRKNQGANVPFGEGDTDIHGVLNLLRTKKYKIPAMIEYEYPGNSDPVTEVKACYDYLRRALA